MNLVSFLILALIAVAFIASVRYTKKHGTCSGCEGVCSGCAGGCTPEMKKKEMEMLRKQKEQKGVS